MRKPVATGIMRPASAIEITRCWHHENAHRRGLGAPLGTSIYASGNGIIDKVGWESGYGKYIRSATPTATRPPMAT